MCCHSGTGRCSSTITVVPPRTSASLKGLAYVVMDEVHYLADRFRGAVWEEVIIHLPASVRLVSLSATVSNAEEFADWLVTVRGDTRVIVDEHRPVPLWQHMLVGTRIFDLFRGGETGREVDPELVRYVRERERYVDPVRRGGRARGWRPSARIDVIDRLDRDGLLPAITFIFSRAGCDAAVQQCVAAGLRLNTNTMAGSSPSRSSRSTTSTRLGIQTRRPLPTWRRSP